VVEIAGARVFIALFVHKLACKFHLSNYHLLCLCVIYLKPILIAPLINI
jgi:hypothetical protein